MAASRYRDAFNTSACPYRQAVLPAPHCAAMTAFFLARYPRRQAGAAAIEFAIAGTVVLLLGLLSVEAGRWHVVRQLAHVALMEAGRAGATAHGHPARIHDAFEDALLPLYVGAGGEPGARRRQAQQTASIVQQGLTPWRIEVLTPSQRDFLEHSRQGLAVSAAPGRRAISNDYLDVQHARRPARPGSPTIFDANTLTLRLTYLHRPWLAPIRVLLRRLVRADPASYASAAWARGWLPIQMTLEIEMHTHPVDWAGVTPTPRGMVMGACTATHCG